MRCSDQCHSSFWLLRQKGRSTRSRTLSVITSLQLTGLVTLLESPQPSQYQFLCVPNGDYKTCLVYFIGFLQGSNEVWCMKSVCVIQNYIQMCILVILCHVIYCFHAFFYLIVQFSKSGSKRKNRGGNKSNIRS